MQGMSLYSYIEALYWCHKPVVESGYSSTVSCPKACYLACNIYMQLHRDETIILIDDDVMM
jgi:hypothetical protein